MHAGAPPAALDSPHTWPVYFAKLGAAGAFEGGSSIGGGMCISKTGTQVEITAHLAGYIRIRAENLEAVRALLAGNPVYEAGGTIEIRELPPG